MTKRFSVFLENSLQIRQKFHQPKPVKDAFLKLLSYWIPIRLKRIYSPINGWLEINLLSGKKVLDTSKSNYSYGSLQRILKTGLEHIPLHNVEKILVLGAGGGSVVATLRHDFCCKAWIDLVDIDEIVIQLAQHQFGLAHEPKLNFFIDDAFHYLEQTSQHYNLIIVDLFIEDKIPELFLKPPFLELLVSHLQKRGYVLFNTMKRTLPTQQFDALCRFFHQKNFLIKVIKNVEFTNNLLIAHQL